jgi:formiminotetrahydrofolate cyclodeaminase
MPASIWPGTLASFCDDVAGSNPAPAAVAASAVTAALGLSLLIKVLEIAGNRKSFTGDSLKLKTLIEAARVETEALKKAADHDIEAVRLYLESRDPVVAQNAIEVPMRAARAAVAGLDLCAEAAEIQGVTKGLPAADLAAAVLLLSTAARAILLSVQFNLRQVDSAEPYRAEIAAERQALEDHAARQADAVLRLIPLDAVSG